MPVNYENIGERVRYYRTLRNLTQEQLAKLSNVSKPLISAVERGERAPSLETIINIANSLNLPMDKLIAESLNNSDNKNEDISILLDCSHAESDILIESMKGLKQILRKYDIK